MIICVSKTSSICRSGNEIRSQFPRSKQMQCTCAIWNIFSILKNMSIIGFGQDSRGGYKDRSVAGTENTTIFYDNISTIVGDKLNLELELKTNCLKSAQHIFPDENGICRSETTYDHRLLWPCLEAISKKNDLTFWPGEVILTSMRASHEQHSYKVDATIRYDDIEMLLLKTSGPFKNCDKSRHVFDHVKGAFGSRCMFQRVFSKYYYGEVSIAKRLRVFFVNARGKSF